MKGPTMRRRACGSARRTSKWPRSTLRGTMTRSMASAAVALPGGGSLPGKKLMTESSLFHIQRLGTDGLAVRVERDLLDPCFGKAQKLLAAALERLAALVNEDRFFERHLAFFQALDDGFKLLDGALER